jgi:regulator of RNase E activity RraB
MAVHEGELSTLDVQAFVKEAHQSIQDLIQGGSNGSYLAFLEMHPSKEDIIMMVAVRIQRALHELTKGHKTENGLIVICNCAHPQDKIELILFYLYERQASI